MGIYGALSTAVTGLRAQSFALENVSGNIANSQTIGFKRIDTDFVDLIPDAAPKRQTSGSVLAQAHSTNNVQGDVKGAATETYMAINGNGFFIVEPRAGQADGSATFSGANFYTRRGDFQPDDQRGQQFFAAGLHVTRHAQRRRHATSGEMRGTGQVGVVKIKPVHQHAVHQNRIAQRQLCGHADHAGVATAQSVQCLRGHAL